MKLTVAALLTIRVGALRKGIVVMAMVAIVLPLAGLIPTQAAVFGGPKAIGLSFPITAEHEENSIAVNARMLFSPNASGEPQTAAWQNGAITVPVGVYNDRAGFERPYFEEYHWAVLAPSFAGNSEARRSLKRAIDRDRRHEPFVASLEQEGVKVDQETGYITFDTTVEWVRKLAGQREILYTVTHRGDRERPIVIRFVFKLTLGAESKQRVDYQPMTVTFSDVGWTIENYCKSYPLLQWHGSYCEADPEIQELARAYAWKKFFSRMYTQSRPKDYEDLEMAYLAKYKGEADDRFQGLAGQLEEAYRERNEAQAECERLKSSQPQTHVELTIIVRGHKASDELVIEGCTDRVMTRIPCSEAGESVIKRTVAFGEYYLWVAWKGGQTAIKAVVRIDQQGIGLWDSTNRCWIPRGMSLPLRVMGR